MRSFKQYLQEGGFPFYNVVDPEKLDVFGHTEKNLVKPPKPKKETKDEKDKKTKTKLGQYLKYAKVADDE